MRIFCLLLSLLSMPSLAATLHIRADEWYPMNGEPQSELPGYMIELAQHIFEPMGINVDYQLLPWKRALAEARKGSVDCVVGALKEEAPDFIYPQHHWGIDQASVYVLKQDNWRFKGQLSEFSKRSTGVILGYFYGDGLDEYITQHSGNSMQVVTGEKPLQQNISKLLAGRINGMIETNSVMKSHLKHLQISHKIIVAGSVGLPAAMYIACSPIKLNSQRYVNIIDQAMPKLRKSGKLKSILARYGLPLWPLDKP